MEHRGKGNGIQNSAIHYIHLDSIRIQACSCILDLFDSLSIYTDTQVFGTLDVYLVSSPWARRNSKISPAYADNPSALLLCVIDLDLKGVINYATMSRLRCTMRGYSMGGRNCGCTTPAKSCDETTHQTVTLSRLARTSAALLQEHQLRCCVFLGGKVMDNMQSRFSTLDIHPKCDFYICIIFLPDQVIQVA